MKKYLLLIFLLGFLASPRAQALDFIADDLIYWIITDESLNPTTNVCVVGSMLYEGADVIVPETVSFEGKDYTVTIVGGFGDRDSGSPFPINSLHLPSSVSYIDDKALYVEEKITIDENNPYFKVENGVLLSIDGSIIYGNVHSIDNAYIPYGVKKISDLAFSHCKNITEVTLPETVEEIGQLAFYNCINLHSINLNVGLKKIQGICGESKLLTIDIPASVTEISASGLELYGLENINVDPDNEVYSSFDGCLYDKELTSLKKVPSGRKTITFSGTIRTIWRDAFSHSEMEEIILPDGIYNIQGNAFSGSKIKTIKLPNTIETLESSLFAGCRNLVEIQIPASVKNISNSVFYLCDSLHTVFIPDNVKTVSASAFCLCSNANIIFLGNDVEIIQPENFDPSINFYPSHFATGNTYANLQIAFNNNPEIVKPLPETLFDDLSHSLGPNSQFSSGHVFINFCGFAQGLQFDMTLPEGVNINEMNLTDYTEHCVSSWSQLENGDYRFIAYTSDGAEYVQDPVFEYNLYSDENMKPGNILFHDIIVSASGYEYRLKDENLYLTGYNVNSDQLTEIEEMEEFQLTNPLSVELEGVTYQWHTTDTSVATVDENSVLHTHRPGSFQLAVLVLDPNCYACDYWSQTITVTPALWGDADGSKAIDLADVVAVVNKILEREVENFNAKLADVDRNGRINVVDVTQIVKLVLAQPVPDEGEGDVAGAPGLRELSFGEAQLGADGKRHISLEIETSSDYTAMQTDIELPEGYTVESVSLGSELGKHVLDYAAVAPQTTRLILYSASLAELPAGRKAAVVDLTLSGTGEGSIRASRALACDADGRSYTLAATEAPLNLTTGVSSAESAGMSATAVAGGMEITAPEGTAVTVSDIAGRVLLSFTADGAPAFRPFAPGVYVVAFEASAATAKVLVK